MLRLQHLVAHHLLWVEEVQLVVKLSVHLLQAQPLEPEFPPPLLDGVHGGGGGRAAGEQGEGLGHVVHGELHPLPLLVPGLPPGVQGGHLDLLLLPLPDEQGVGARARPGRRQEARGQAYGVRWGPGLAQELEEEGGGDGGGGGQWGVQRLRSGKVDAVRRNGGGARCRCRYPGWQR